MAEYFAASTCLGYNGVMLWKGSLMGDRPGMHIADV